MRTLVAQFARFGVVGAVGFVIDFAVFNLLIATFLPGFSRAEYRGLCLAVDEFERLARIEAERENPRHWPSTERVQL